MSDRSSGSPCCKIGRGIEKYDCDGLNDELASEYREGDASLRDLERVINEAFTAAALEAAGSPTDRDPGDITATLRGDDESKRQQARLETELEQAGVDVDQLQRDYVSFRTVKTHLNEHLDVDTSRNETITLDSAESIIEWAETRCTSVIERTLERLSNADEATIGDDFTVNISPRITCHECNSTLTVREFIGNEGCRCGSNHPS